MDKEAEIGMVAQVWEYSFRRQQHELVKRRLVGAKPGTNMKEECVGSRQDISCLAFHAPSTVASGDVSGVTLVWDLRNGELRYRFTNPSNQEEGSASTPAVNQLLFVDPPGCFPGTLLLTASGRQMQRDCTNAWLPAKNAESCLPAFREIPSTAIFVALHELNAITPVSSVHLAGQLQATY